MRVALIVVAVAFVASPSFASPSCMTQTEARKHFGNKHLYWHGPDRCWDANPGRRRLAQRIRDNQRIKEKEQRPTVREAQVERAPAEEKKPPDGTQESGWRKAMSKMLPDDFVSVQPRAHASAEPADEPPPRMNWRDRWVDVAQRFPPVVDKSEPADLVPATAANADPIVTPSRVMLGLLAFVLLLGITQVLNRGDLGKEKVGSRPIRYAILRFSRMLRKSAARLR